VEWDRTSLRDPHQQEVLLSDHIYKIIQLVGSSPTSVEDAIQNAVTRASTSLKNLRWFEVLETRGQIEGGKVTHYQVTLKVGFTLDDTIDPGA
jgi:flavin-binding protein dodecin